MVGKLSNDAKMSASRIPVLYCWAHGAGHPYSTPNEELSRSIAALAGENTRFDIGEPGVVGNLLEPALARSACELLGILQPDLSPPVMKREHFEVSCDAISRRNRPVRIESSDLVTIIMPGGPVDELVVEGDLPVEVKCTSDYPTDEPPAHRGPIQLQMQMMALSASYGVLVTLHRGIERRVVVYQRDPEICQRIDELSADFWERVQSERYYAPISVEDAACMPASEQKTERDIGELEDDIERLERLRADRAQFDSEIEQIETRIMAAIGDAHVGTTPRYRVEWPVRHYKAQPEKVTPAREARTIRLKSLKVKAII